MESREADMTHRSACAVFATAVCLAAPAVAHHSAAMFDTSREVTLEGVVTTYDWRNPHVYMAIRTTGPDGAEFEQQIEAGASSVLLPLGLTPDAVRPGDRVTVRANPSRRGAGRTVLGRELVKRDGTVLPLFIGSAPSRTAPSDAVATSIAGTWFPPRTGFFTLNGARRSWQLTERGRTAVEQFDSMQTAHADCIPVTAPTLMVYPVTSTVEVRDDRVIFRVDWMSSERVVYLDGRGHPEDGERTLHGHSIGHWEGETLIVDTTQFSDHKEGTAIGLPSGAGKHLIERFSLSEDRRHLIYDVLLEDPEYLAEPVTHRSEWDHRPDLEPTGLACDLEVARRFQTQE
jgi:hypothetical protein